MTTREQDDEALRPVPCISALDEDPALGLVVRVYTSAETPPAGATTYAESCGLDGVDEAVAAKALRLRSDQRLTGLVFDALLKAATPTNVLPPPPYLLIGSGAAARRLGLDGDRDFVPHEGVYLDGPSGELRPFVPEGKVIVLSYNDPQGTRLTYKPWSTVVTFYGDDRIDDLWPVIPVDRVEVGGRPGLALKMTVGVELVAGTVVGVMA